MAIYKSIVEDHNIQRDLCERLLNTSGESDERKSIWQQLQKELEVHEIAEERFFYMPLIDTDRMIEDARHGMAEHHEIDSLIKELNDTDMSSPSWLATAKKLTHQVNHHLDDEEQEFFNKAKKVYSSEEADELGQDYVKEVKEYKSGWPDSIPWRDEKN